VRAVSASLTKRIVRVCCRELVGDSSTVGKLLRDITMISLLSQADCSGKSAVIYKRAQVVTVKRVTTDAISLTQLIWVFNCVLASSIANPTPD
jgi:hypothetical protein